MAPSATKPPVPHYGSIVVEGIRDKKPLMSSSRRKSVSIKTQSSFYEDLRGFKQGSIPHSMIVATTVGVVCGVVAWLYYAFLEWALEYVWKTLPERVLDLPALGAAATVAWIPLVGLGAATCVGWSVVYAGEPGDLPYTIKCVHERAFIGMDHVLPMVLASQFSILGGGSLGPEAPLVAICAALGGFLSRKVFGISERNLVRKHTLMGMAGALAAFFGCPLGGSLFALEVCGRFGIEYFEHTIEAVFCGEVCLTVFRALAGLPIGAIWTITDAKLESTDSVHILYGMMLGLTGAAVTFAYANFHTKVMGLFTRLDLLDNSKAVQRAWLGAAVVVGLGVLIPQTMFWGEYEFKTISTLQPAATLEHIWPTSGAVGFEMDSFWTCLVVGVAKLVAISFTVAGGYRGGYIFPLFASAAAFGRAIYFVCPFIPVQLCVLCMAAAVNVAVTRTTIATTLILAYLSNEPNAISAILCSALVSLFVTGYMPFIKTQVSRVDLEHSLYHEDDVEEEEIDDAGNSERTEALTPFTEEHKHASDIVV